MKITLPFLISLLCTAAQAQSWSYVGSSCPNTEGSAKIKIKSNGNIVSASYSFNQMYVKEWNGSTWTALPAPATTGVIGTFQLEMHNDTAYLGVSNNGFKCFKWNGSGWSQLGAVINTTFSEGNHDFVLDNNGVPFVCHSVNRNIYRFNGSAWSVVHTLPQGSFPVTYGYQFGVDNSIVFNSNNELMYSTVALNRQFFKKLVGGNQEVLVGDTAVRLASFTQYGVAMKKNANGEIFALFGKFGSRSFVKRLVGNSWQNYGDSATFGMPSGFHLLEFASPSTLIMGVSGNVDKKVWMVSGPNSPFQLLDLISHTGNFTQLTDLEINPVDGKPYVAFNCILTHSLMRYDLQLTTSSATLNKPEMVQVFPNPSADGIFHLALPPMSSEAVEYSVYSTDGKQLEAARVKEGETKPIDLSNQPGGIYILKMRTGEATHIRRLLRF